MTQANIVTTDLERDASDEDYLDNTSVVSLSWREIKVETGNWASDVKPKQIISAVNGFSEAGKCAPSHNFVRLLTKPRGSGSHNGAIWFRENDSAQCTCSPKCCIKN